ncbi:GerMN domain-containing protein [Candidatus Poribacteria bacterium]|nr:GerMN domain-containing protein [Candidatus Poribacteria bacterium]
MKGFIRIKYYIPLALIFIFLTAFMLNLEMFAQMSVSPQESLTAEVSLYFLDAFDQSLKPEKRSIKPAFSTVEQAKMTLTELINGSNTGLISPIPEGTELLELFIDEKGCAYPSFSYAMIQNHPGGTITELITISSIVKTLTVNYPEEIRRVKILIGNKEVKTLAGHIDISKPIFPFEIK